MERNSSASISQIRIVAAFFLFYVTLLGLTCCLKYETFQYTDFDLAVHTQSLHNLLRGSLDCSILGIPFPGNHMALSLLLVAPFYALFPSAATLLLFQTVMLAAGAIAVFLYAKKYLEAPYPAIIASLYLLYPPLIYMNLYEFHPVALATTFLLFALLAYDTKRPLLYTISLLLAMSCQENIALIVILLGIKAIFERRSFRWSLYPITAGIAWFIACIFWIMPIFNPGIMKFDVIYGHLGESLPEILASILRHPVNTFMWMTSAPNILYVLGLLLPLALTSLVAPSCFFPALPVIAQRLLSARGTETTIMYHYQAELIPFVFIAAVHGLHRLGKLRSARWQSIASSCMVIMTILALHLSGVPAAIMTAVTRSRESRQLDQMKRQLIARIPDDANVTATFRYLPRLANRDSLHSLHHIYTGYYTLSTTHYPLPADQDFLLLDTDDPLTFGRNGFFTPGGESNIQNLVEINNMSLVLRAGQTILLMKAADAK